MKALAVDLGGSHVSYGLVNEGTLVASGSFRISDGKLSDVLERLAEPLLALKSQTDCSGIAVGFCGLVDPVSCRITSTNGKYEDARSVDLTSWARNILQLPLALENDARLALLGEQFAGAARGFDDVVMITLGTGIGAATMMNGQLLRGKHYQAGCLGGHFVVNYRGRECTCGNIGCLEAEASTWSLPAAYPNFEALIRASENDAEARRLFQDCLNAWAAGCVSLIHAYDPEVLVLGGGVMAAADKILPALETHIHRRAWTPWGKVQVRAAELGTSAALLGAVPLLQLNK